MKYIVALVIIIALSVSANNSMQIAELKEANAEYEIALADKNEIIKHMESYLQDNVSHLESVNEFLDELQIQTFEVTAYAPLDPNAIEGMCYSGDPNITYTGDSPIPYATGAGDVSLLGKRIYIEDIGIIKINDIGGMIGRDDVDLVMKTRQEALEFGRQELNVIILD